MTRTRMLAASCVLPAAALIFVGCAQKVATGPATQPADSQLAAGDTSARVREIDTRVGELSATSQQLPGDSDASHRQLVGQYFADLTRVLPLIEGDYQSGEFRQGLRVLNSSREQLTAGSKDLASEPTIGQGLRASERLLRNLNTFVFDNNPDITKKLDELQKKVTELDTAHGGLNRVLSAQALKTATDILQRMSTALNERAGKDAAAPKPDAATSEVK